LDVHAKAIVRDWIDQPAIDRRAQLDPHRALQLGSVGPGGEDEFDKLERHVHSLIDERRARARNAERTTGRGLGLDIN
ncbi:MAG: hypothetical protein ACC652_10010, partial [Acidimicrobiales bacterium]